MPTPSFFNDQLLSDLVFYNDAHQRRYWITLDLYDVFSSTPWVFSSNLSSNFSSNPDFSTIQLTSIVYVWILAFHAVDVDHRPWNASSDFVDLSYSSAVSAAAAASDAAVSAFSDRRFIGASGFGAKPGFPRLVRHGPASPASNGWSRVWRNR